MIGGPRFGKARFMRACELFHEINNAAQRLKMSPDEARATLKALIRCWDLSDASIEITSAEVDTAFRLLRDELELIDKPEKEIPRI